jgi:hypothetical protein
MARFIGVNVEPFRHNCAHGLRNRFTGLASLEIGLYAEGTLKADNNILTGGSG